ncbi:ketopantoate reductase PanE/ApbA C terminal-domain-containing protein [Boletus edulis]|nr:ketopantoate reductase PanE/ApbA C terminal-domain-containing protein [Boletus edulis]
MEVFEQGDCSGAGIPFDSTLSRDEVKRHSPPPENLRTDLIEALFVTTKAQNTTGAISRMLPRLTPRSTIVLLQNGMGIYEDLVEKLFRNPESRPHFIIASNIHGAWLKSPLHVVHAGVGDIEFGIIPDSRGRDFEVSLSDESKPLHERELSLDDIARQGEPYYAEYSTLLDGLSCKWRRMSDVQRAMRKKLVVNSVVNPLTAILGCRNGALFKDGASKRMRSWKLIHMPVLGSLAPDAERSQAPLGRMPHELQADMLGQEVKRVAQLTRGNISSMLSDIRKGRPTEISFLNGYLVRLGKQYGVPMPVNSALLNMVNMRSAIPIDQLF